jgi:hypothetical protein
MLQAIAAKDVEAIGNIYREHGLKSLEHIDEKHPITEIYSVDFLEGLRALLQADLPPDSKLVFRIDEARERKMAFSLIEAAVAFACDGFAELLVEMGAHPTPDELQFLVERGDIEALRAIPHPVQRGTLDIVRLLSNPLRPEPDDRVLAVLEWLLEGGFRPTVLALGLAAENGQMRTVHRLLDLGLDPHEKSREEPKGLRLVGPASGSAMERATPAVRASILARLAAAHAARTAARTAARDRSQTLLDRRSESALPFSASPASCRPAWKAGSR